MSETKGQGALPVIGAVLGLFGTTVGIWSQVDSRVQQGQIAELEADLKQRQDARASVGAERDYLIRVTDKVLQSIDSPNAQRQQVAALLIDTLGDVEIQKRLRNALLAAAVSDVKPALARTIRAEAEFAAANQEITAPASPAAATPPPGVVRQVFHAGQKLAVDIFWCEGTDGAARKLQAQLLFDAADQKGLFSRIRLRPLAESVNRRPGFGLITNEIRYQDGEENAATTLKSLAPANWKVTLRRVNYNTPLYISAFVCSAPG